MYQSWYSFLVNMYDCPYIKQVFIYFLTILVILSWQFTVPIKCYFITIKTEFDFICKLPHARQLKTYNLFKSRNSRGNLKIQLHIY